VSKSEQFLGEDDIRTVVRLVAYACDPAGAVDGDGAKQRLMRALAERLDADAWLWLIARVDEPAQKPIGLCVLHEGLGREQYAAMVEDAEPDGDHTPIDRAMMELIRQGRPFAQPRHAVIEDDQWYGHPSVERCYLDHGIDHTMFCGVPLGEPGLVSVQALYRKIGKPAFSRRDQRLVELIIGEVSWLHRVGLPGDDGRSAVALSPRLRSVLILLLEGRSRNEIAELLSLSPHTVKDYIQAVYRHFNVTSQAKLIHRFRVGDGDGSPDPDGA